MLLSRPEQSGPKRKGGWKTENYKQKLLATCCWCWCLCRCCCFSFSSWVAGVFPTFHPTLTLIIMPDWPAKLVKSCRSGTVKITPPFPCRRNEVTNITCQVGGCFGWLNLCIFFYAALIKFLFFGMFIFLEFFPPVFCGR